MINDANISKASRRGNAVFEDVMSERISEKKKSRLHNVIQYFCFIFFSSWSLDPGIKLMLHRKSSLLMCCAMIWHRSARGSTAIESMCFIMTCIEIMTGHMLISQGEKLFNWFLFSASTTMYHSTIIIVAASSRLAQFKASIRLDGVQQLGLQHLVVLEIGQLE